ncbi:MAG: polymerase sigma-70 factor, partial [Frankiales bacterium]|nr:polymerase sigma-70 factor [Frankiales bacterium]
ASCRQLHRRARLALGPDQPAAADRRAVLDRFLDALASGDVMLVASLLVDDAVLVSDGGGVVSAARRLVVGADRVARFFLGLLQKGEPVEVEVAEVNGGPAVVARRGGVVTQVLVLDAVGDRVRRLLLVSNPEKLQAFS